MAQISDYALQKMYDKYAITANGTLNKNDVINQIFNKISNVYWDSNFNGSGPIQTLLERYLRASNQYGDTDEINAVYMANREDFGWNEKWHTAAYFPKTTSKWIGLTYEDKYPLSIMETHMARAVSDSAQFGSMIGMFMASVPKAKAFAWYKRLQEWIPKNTVVVEVDTKTDGIEAVGKKITELIKAFQLPMTQYNGLKMPTIYKRDDINVTMNYLSQNELMWDTAKIFHQMDIDGIKDILNRSLSIEMANKNTYAVVDVSQSLYIGQVGPSLNLFQQFAENKYTSFFLHETWKVGTLDFHNRVAICEKGSKPDPDPDPTPDEKKEIAIDKKELSVVVGDKGTIKVTNASDLKGLSVKSSDEKTATAELAKDTITITGVKEGSADITISATNGKADVVAKITVTKKSEVR